MSDTVGLHSILLKLVILMLKLVKMMLSTLTRVSTSCKRLMHYMRSTFLMIMLSLIYLLIVVPIALRKRRDSHSDIATWKDCRSRVGWRSNEQSTADLKIFSNHATGRDALEALAEQRGDEWILLLYDLLTKLRPLAQPPKEKKLMTL